MAFLRLDPAVGMVSSQMVRHDFVIDRRELVNFCHLDWVVRHLEEGPQRMELENFCHCNQKVEVPSVDHEMLVQESFFHS